MAAHRPARLDRLVGVVQNYAWGDLTSIADILGQEPSGQPEAEYWMGAHPKAPGVLSDGVTLFDAIAADRDGWLGPAAAHFDGLPYLFKILAAAQPLSIQAHPSREQAIAGFAAENDSGPAIDAPDRTYRDPNHKPEMLCALTPFEALCGFRPEASLRTVLDGITAGPALDPLRAFIDGPGPWDERLRTIVTWLLGSDHDPSPTRRRLIQALSDGPATTNASAARAIEIASLAASHYPGDPGIVITLLLNPLTLAPGESIFLRAGNVHAYLKGTAIELMANSDNVVRCGLTPKHVDTDELLRIARFETIDPPIQRAEPGPHRFSTPVPEFALTKVSLSPASAPDGIEFGAGERRGPDLLLVVDGSVQLLADDGDELLLTRGQVAAVPFGSGGYVIAGDGELFISGVGHH